MADNGCDKCGRLLVDMDLPVCDLCGRIFCSDRCAELSDCDDLEVTGGGIYWCVFCKLKQEQVPTSDHVWGMGWQESDIPHPGFGGSTDIYGGYVDQCEKCGMYGYEYRSGTIIPGKYEGQPCGEKIRDYC